MTYYVNALLAKIFSDFFVAKKGFLTLRETELSMNLLSAKCVIYPLLKVMCVSKSMRDNLLMDNRWKINSFAR